MPSSPPVPGEVTRSTPDEGPGPLSPQPETTIDLEADTTDRLRNAGIEVGSIEHAGPGSADLGGEWGGYLAVVLARANPVPEELPPEDAELVAIPGRDIEVPVATDPSFGRVAYLNCDYLYKVSLSTADFEPVSDQEQLNQLLAEVVDVLGCT